MKTTKTIITALLCAAATACAPADETPMDPQVGQTGMNLRSDILADTDVAGMAYTIAPVDCESGLPVDGQVIEVVRDLEDMLLPGGHPGFEDQPFDADSEHLFADHFQALPAGCYDVQAQPVDADGQPSADCAPAVESGVEVSAGAVTEVMLISQCESDSVGALDAIVALNHAPEISDIWYEPSKFTCGDSTTICVVASDADSDPLTLSGRGGEGVRLTQLRPREDEDGRTVHCLRVDVPGPGVHQVTVTVHDQMYTPEGELVTIESQLGEGLTSNASITVPVHALEAEACVCDCPEGFALNAAGDACERFAEADAVFNGQEYQVCEGNDREEYGALGAIFPDGLEVLNPFFGSGWDVVDGRLNATGIWVCGQRPLNEWIGFSTCIEVEEAGEYVMGISGDDEVRVTVDGVEVFRNPANQDGVFNRWWMVPVTLTPGTHVIEMEGIDYMIAAALGAEIYGPFPAGSTADDASMAALDYANNIIWSTAEMVGGNFHTGTNSGYSCPDGTSLNLCGEAPTCTGFEQVACQ